MGWGTWLAIFCVHWNSGRFVKLGSDTPITYWYFQHIHAQLKLPDCGGLPHFDISLKGISVVWSPWYDLRGMIFVVWSYPRYGGLLAWILTLNKSLLCHCSKAVSMTIFFSHFTEHHIFFQKPESSAVWKYIGHSEFCGAPFIFGPRVFCLRSLVEETSARRMPRSECVSAPMPRRRGAAPNHHHLVHTLVVHTLTLHCTYSFSLSYKLLLLVYTVTPRTYSHYSSYIFLLLV